MNLDWLTVESDSLVDAARLYADHGLAIFPCNGKKPITPRGLYDATTDLNLVDEWWSQNPSLNIGMPMGGPRRLVAIDVDGAEGLATRRRLEGEHEPLPFTLRATTGGGGEHWIFVAPEGVKISNRARVAPGIDVRSDGGYIIVAPSLHASGKRYRWHSIVEPQPMPAWLVELVRVHAVEHTPYAAPVVLIGGQHDACVCEDCVTARSRKARPRHERCICPPCRRLRYGQAVLCGVAEEVATAVAGTRNATLNRAWWRVGQFSDAVNQGEARRTLHRAALACGLAEREIEGVLR